jgi:hypothetical protein
MAGPGHRVPVRSRGTEKKLGRHFCFLIPLKSLSKGGGKRSWARHPRALWEETTCCWLKAPFLPITPTYDEYVQQSMTIPFPQREGFDVLTRSAMKQLRSSIKSLVRFDKFKKRTLFKIRVDVWRRAHNCPESVLRLVVLPTCWSAVGHRAPSIFSRNRFSGVYKLLNFSILCFLRRASTYTTCSDGGPYVVRQGGHSPRTQDYPVFLPSSGCACAVCLSVRQRSICRPCLDSTSR